MTGFESGQASTRRKFKLRLVLLLRHHEVGAELVAALRHETLDQVAAAVLDELLDLFDRNIEEIFDDEFAGGDNG